MAISDSAGAVYDENGLDIGEISRLKQHKKSVGEYSGGKSIPAEDVLTCTCDILIPAALENQITFENADMIQAQYILELAN